MNLSISGVFKQIGGFFSKMSKKKRIAIIAAVSVLVVGAIVLTAALNKSSYSVLYRGLSSSEGAEVLDILDGLGAEYKVDDNGTIYVPSRDEARLKMQLAAEGYPKESLTYDIFSGVSGLMTTDYEKKQYLIFQLQDRLQDAIKTLSGINNAIVTLNIADDNSFVLKKDEKVSTASVVLDLSPWAKLTQKQIKGIEELVAKSVSGLSADNVAIIDGEGNILNGTEAESGLSGAYTQLELAHAMNNLYQQKILSLLKPVLGEKGVSVSVNVVLDFSQRSSEEIIYTPVVGDNGIISHYDYDNSSSNGGSVPGGVVGTGSNTGTPSYQEEDEEGEHSSDSGATASGSVDYLVNQMIKTVIDNGGTIKDMTVAVFINKKELPAEAAEEYRSIIAYGAGIAPEKVALACVEFLPEDDDKEPQPSQPIEEKKTLAELLGISELVLYAIAGGLGLIICIVTVVLIVVVRKKKKRKALLKKQAEAEQEAAKKNSDVPGEIVLNETREQLLKKQIKEFSSANPEIVAQLLRSWMKEDDAK